MAVLYHDQVRSIANTALLLTNVSNWVRDMHFSTPRPAGPSQGRVGQLWRALSQSIAATDSSGSGALICPDENRLAALADNAVDASGNHKSESQWEEFKRFGCSYVPPGTEMISQGANEHGSLAIVSAKLPDGTLIHGVTFPTMFTKNPVQREESLGERSAEAKGPQQSATDEMPEPQRTRAQENAVAEETDGGPFIPGTNGVGYPSCIYCPDPQYTAENRASGINGTVTLKIFVSTDGHATDIQTVKSLGHGLDELAVETIKKWRFKAALGPTGMPSPQLFRSRSLSGLTKILEFETSTHFPAHEIDDISP